ncbi:MAG: sugar ABC transporter permease [Chloroflexi bacterium]|nr:sugar ABC transporter permease [Chloroflexota bacterium]MCY3937146.1 sugar ABC transporter permease [Chloroflexota bacterium]
MVSGRFALSRRTRRAVAGYSFAAPATLLLVVFSFIAIIWSFVLSLYQFHWLQPDERVFVGFDQYATVFTTPLFWKSMRNTAQYVGLLVPSVAIISLLLAVAGNQISTGRAVFRTLFFIPHITPTVVLSLIWIWLYEPTGGINHILGLVGLPKPNWLLSEFLAMPAIVILSVWAAIGFYMVIFLAGIADIPSVFYEAARVDGANRWHTFRYITVPLLVNTIAFVLITMVIGAFQVFTYVYIMTQGGPINATIVVQWMIYHNAFEIFKMGYAAAMSWVLFGVIFFFTAVQLKVFRSRQLY